MVHVNGNSKLCTPFTSPQRDLQKEKENRIYAQHLFLTFFLSFHQFINGQIQGPTPNKTIHSTIISPYNTKTPSSSPHHHHHHQTPSPSSSSSHLPQSQNKSKSFKLSTFFIIIISFSAKLQNPLTCFPDKPTFYLFTFFIIFYYNIIN